MRYLEYIHANCNVSLLMRERGKIVPGSRREGHNVFTTSGRNWLTKLVAWDTVAGTDIPYTNKRVRWIGVGKGTQTEVSNVASLVTPVLVNSTSYLVALDLVEFPTSTSARFIKEFSLNEITITGVPVQVTELGLFVDVNPAVGFIPQGTEDVASISYPTTLNPTVTSNPPVAYKAFEALTKTVDFTLEVRWDLRFT